MFGTLFGFKRRLSRVGFVESLLAIVLIDVAAILIAGAIGEYGLPGGYFVEHPVAPTVARAIPVLFFVLTLWALLAVSVKRCHDRNRSGWLVLIAVIPVIGQLWLLVDLFLLRGTRGRNRYGPEPHGDPAEEATGWQGEFIREAPGAVAPAGLHDGLAAQLDWTGRGQHADARAAGHRPDPAEALGAYSPPPAVVEEPAQGDVRPAPVEAEHANSHEGGDAGPHAPPGEDRFPELPASGQEAGGPDAHSRHDASGDQAHRDASGDHGHDGDAHHEDAPREPAHA